jgi:hypothetical protein
MEREHEIDVICTYVIQNYFVMQVVHWLFWIQSLGQGISVSEGN